MAKKKYKEKHEFRYNKRTNHLNYIFEDDGTNYTAVGLTHSSKTFGKKNMPLKDNPHKGKSKKAYVRYGIIHDQHDSFQKKLKNFSFSTEDYSRVKSKIRNYKKNRKKRK